MRRPIQSLLACIFAVGLLGSLQAQTTCNCGPDLEMAYKLIRKSTSYKDQIKGEAKTQYTATYEALREKAEGEMPVWECYQLLQGLLVDIRDNHLEINGTAEAIPMDKLQDAEFGKEFKASPVYHIFPQVGLDMDSLEAALERKSPHEISGIYQSKLMKMGIFKLKDQGVYLSVILESQIQTWERGQVFMRLESLGKREFRCITGLWTNKRLVTYKEREAYGFLEHSGWTKDPDAVNESFNIWSKKRYDLEQINQNLQYLRLGSFNSWNPTLAQADSFATALQGQLTAPFLIVDLRSNGGGGDRNSNQFFELLQEYLQDENHHVIVLINFRTASNAEQFTVRLMDLERVEVMGQPSSGTIAYGRNKSRYAPLPSGFFSVSITDSRYPEYLDYEEVGISPAVRLTYGENWIDQIYSILNDK